MKKSYISIRSDQGIVYEGEGTIFEDDWRMKVEDGILARPWYSLIEIRKESEDKAMISVFTAFKEDFYRIGDRPIFSSTCSLNFLENILKNIKDKK